MLSSSGLRSDCRKRLPHHITGEDASVDDDGPPHDDDDTSGTSHIDVLVLGAGISGLVSASVLLAQDAGRVLVVDE